MPVKAARIPPRGDAKPAVSNKPVRRPPGEDVTLAEKRLAALEYRREGFSYRDIALMMNTSLSTAFQWVQGELNALRQLTHEQAEDVRDMELQRLDMMLRSMSGGILAGDPMVISTALRIGERRSKLLGLDAAQKIDAKGAFMSLTPEGVAAMTDDDLQKTIQNLFTLAGGQRALKADPDAEE